MLVKNEARKYTEREVIIALNDAKKNLEADTKVEELEMAKLELYKAIELQEYNVSITLLLSNLVNYLLITHHLHNY